MDKPNEGGARHRARLRKSPVEQEAIEMRCSRDVDMEMTAYSTLERCRYRIGGHLISAPRLRNPRSAWMPIGRDPASAR